MTLTPEELRQSIVNLQATLAYLTAEAEQSRWRLAAVRAALSHHQHDYTRDILSKPTTFAPATHTHSYASSTHVHDYLDSQVGPLDSDIGGTTDFAREP